MELKNKLSYFILFILASGSFLLPLVFWPPAPIPYEIPKVWFFDRWVELLTLVVLFYVLFFAEKRRLDTSIIIISIIFFFIAIVSSLLGSDINKSFLGNYYRADGLITLFHLVCLFFSLALIWKRDFQRSVTYSILAGSVATSIWSLIDGIRLYILGGYPLFVWGGAIGSTFGQPKFLTGYLLVTFPLLWYIVDKETGFKKQLGLIGIIIQSIAILLTKSWAGVLILIFLILFYFFDSRIKIQYKKILLFFTIIVFFILASVFIYTKLQKRNVLKVQGKIVAEGRERIFNKLFLSFLKRPFLGWGWANVDHAFEASVWPIKFDKDIYLDKAHSHFLEILTTTGIFGLITYFFLLFFIARNLISNIKKKSKDQQWFKTLFLVFFTFIIHSQTNVISISEEIIFWFIAGITASDQRIS